MDISTKACPKWPGPLQLRAGVPLHHVAAAPCQHQALELRSCGHAREANPALRQHGSEPLQRLLRGVPTIMHLV